MPENRFTSDFDAKLACPLPRGKPVLFLTVLYFALPSFQHGLRPNDLISSAQHDKSGFAPGGARYKKAKYRITTNFTLIPHFAFHLLVSCVYPRYTRNAPISSHT